MSQGSRWLRNVDINKSHARHYRFWGECSRCNLHHTPARKVKGHRAILVFASGGWMLCDNERTPGPYIAWIAHKWLAEILASSHSGRCVVVRQEAVNIRRA